MKQEAFDPVEEGKNETEWITLFDWFENNPQKHYSVYASSSEHAQCMVEEFHAARALVCLACPPNRLPDTPQASAYYANTRQRRVERNGKKLEFVPPMARTAR